MSRSPPPDRPHRPADLHGPAARRHHRALPGGGGLRLRRRLPFSGGGRPHRLLEGPVHQGGQHPARGHGGRGWVSPVLPHPASPPGLEISGVGVLSLRSLWSHGAQHARRRASARAVASSWSEATWGRESPPHLYTRNQSAFDKVGISDSLWVPSTGTCSCLGQAGLGRRDTSGSHHIEGLAGEGPRPSVACRVSRTQLPACGTTGRTPCLKIKRSGSESAP